MSFITYVLAFTDHKVDNKWSVQYAFFRDVKGFQGMHFIDGSNVWHGPQVVDILWQQIKHQKADEMKEDGACNYTTPKVEWLGRFFSTAMHAGNYWVSSGLSQSFTGIDNDIFLNYKRRYVIAQANDDYWRNNFASQKSLNKRGYANWEFADKQPECKEASKKVQGILNGMHKHARELAGIFYRRIRKQGKHLYCFEFREGYPLNECESVWGHVEHYRLAHDP